MRIKNNDALSPVISTVLAAAVVTATVGAVILWGIPYIERLDSQSARENVESQMNIISGVVDSLISSDVGNKKSNILTFSGGSISAGDDIDQTVVTYSHDPDFDFTVTDISDDGVEIKVISDDFSGDISVEMFTNCFLAGTRVLMSDGSYKNIEKLGAGESVFSYDIGSGKPKPSLISHVHSEQVTGSYIEIDGLLKVTPDHEFYLKGGTWISANNIAKGALLFGFNGESYIDYKVSSCLVYSDGEPYDVYDLVIDGNHPYFVSIYENDNIYVLVNSREAESNSPPDVPSNPNPQNQSTNVYVETGLSWTGGNPEKETYDFYFGTTSPPPFNRNNANLTSLFPLIGRLEYNTTYYWRIVAIDNDDEDLKTYGPIWYFTTEMGGSITVISPNGGEAWREDSMQEITWSSIGIPHSDIVTIKLYNETGHSVVLATVPNNGSYLWDMVNNPRWMEPGYHKIKISVGDIYDFSDNFFLVYPIGTSVLTLTPNEITSNAAIFVGKLENATGQIRFRYKEEGATDWIYLSNWHGNYTNEIFYENIFVLLSDTKYVYQAGVKSGDFEIWGNYNYFKTALHGGFPNQIPSDQITITNNADGSLKINFLSPITKTFVINLYINRNGNCFLAGTRVLMSDGSYKNIEDITIGDMVKSYDEKTGSIVDKPVTNVFHQSSGKMTAEYYIIINDVLKVTPNHRFYSDGSWVAAEYLKIGDNLFSKKGEKYSVYSIEYVYIKMPTFDLEIEDYHNYFVSIGDDVDILVHNQDDPEYIGSIFRFRSNSMSYTRSSQDKNVGYVFEKGGIIMYEDDTNEEGSVKDARFTYDTGKFFSMNIVETNFSAFSTSTGSNNMINLRLFSDLEKSYIIGNPLVYNLRLHFFGGYSDSWMDYFNNNYNFEIDSENPFSLKHSSGENGVNLAFTHSITNLRFQQ